MPLFFLSYVDGIVITEPQGIDLQTLDEAREEAARAARDIWLEGKRNGDDRTHWRTEIRDDGDVLLDTVSFKDALEW